MAKFSIIIPVYNSELYLEKCINSVLNQSLKDYEIIAINDNSNDSSLQILSDFGSKIKVHNITDKKGMGPSHARNIGISMATGDYILFLDSDDYYEKDLLKTLDENMNEVYDIIRFQIQYDKNGKKEKTIYNDKTIYFNNGIDAFNEICNYSIIESPCCYAFNRKFFTLNNFKFQEGLLHEDFGLIPLTIIKANKVKCINFAGYNYVIHENSIMTTNTYDKILKKANDLLEHFKYIKDECKNIEGDLSIFNSYLANSLLIKATTLKNSDYKKYIKELKQLDIYDMLLSDTCPRKIKKIIIKLSPKFYYRVIRG